jgi:hypothetical protein
MSADANTRDFGAFLIVLHAFYFNARILCATLWKIFFPAFFTL